LERRIVQMRTKYWKTLPAEIIRLKRILEEKLRPHPFIINFHSISIIFFWGKLGKVGVICNTDEIYHWLKGILFQVYTKSSNSLIVSYHVVLYGWIILSTTIRNTHPFSGLARRSLTKTNRKIAYNLQGVQAIS
jgi:hypothetical protein